MILEKYLDSFYLELVYNHYKEEYINSLDVSNFDKVYQLLRSKGFYFIKDIILKYLEIFEMEVEEIEEALVEIELELGPDYVHKIGKDMTILDRIIEKSIKLESEEDK